MEKLLIVRSASFQQLDMNLSAIQARFPRHEIHLLTHEHGAKLAQSYKDISVIHTYPYRSSFSLIRPVHFLDVKFSTIIVLVANESGAGFLNVLRFALQIPALEYYVCNLVSELRRFSKSEIRRRRVESIVFRVLSSVLVAPILVFSIPFLCIQLYRCKGTKNEVQKSNVVKGA